MAQLTSNISYIICYREASEERRNALLFTIRRIRQYFPDIEIIIVEQDSESKLSLDDSLNIRHLFVYNSGLFNRSWSFNYATKNTTKEIFVFADADIFLEKEGYIICFNSTNDFEAITPNKLEISNVAIDFELKDQIRFLNNRKLYSFAGGMLIITRNAFEKIGGWDERFEGWGGEDDAMSHVIFQKLKSKTFNLPNYHIDHPNEFISGNNQPQYESNKALLCEIITRNGIALDRYIQQLKSFDLGNSQKFFPTDNNDNLKPLKFVLAITTYNRLEYLKSCVESFLQTKNDAFSWQLIIADDNSSDGTKTYLKKLKEVHNAIIIQNNHTNIHHQVNTIIKKLSTMTFDLCFKCDDDIVFLQKGWDQLYWNTIQRTDYHHLVFYDLQWQPYSNLSKPISHGNLESHCNPEEIQGAFYTLTQEVIDKVGYFDEQQFGASGMGHIDYSFRCCRAGFNVLANPFDVKYSNDFIQLQSINTYSSATTLKNKTHSNSRKEIDKKKQLLKMNRVYIAYNENYIEDLRNTDKSEIETKGLKRRISHKYKKADSSFYPERGISGFIGYLLKRIYNFSIDLKLYFIPKGFKMLGRVLNKISIHLMNIEK